MRRSLPNFVTAWLATMLFGMVTCSAPAQAEGAAPAWAGVWHGTIGKAEVQVCLQHEDSRDFGAYYYLRHLALLSLGPLETKAPAAAPAGTAPVWTEAPFSDTAAKGPLWHLTAIAPGHLQGKWSDGKRSLPIDLVSTALLKPPAQASDDGNSDDTICGNRAFSLPRFTTPVVSTKQAMLGHVAYTRVLVDPGKQFEDSATETFQLHGAGPALDRVNKALYANVPTGAATATYFTCSMAALGQNGLDGDAASTMTPLVITSGWLVVQDAESDDCGGAHPNSAVAYQTWDLHKGAQVNLFDWFTKAALVQTVEDAGHADAYVTVTFTARFRALIDRAYPRGDAECRDVERDADVWDPHLTRRGIAFSPELPHAEMACTENSEIPFAALAPYLNLAGKAAVATFRADIRAQQ